MSNRARGVYNTAHCSIYRRKFVDCSAQPASDNLQEEKKPPALSYETFARPSEIAFPTRGNALRGSPLRNVRAPSRSERVNARRCFLLRERDVTWRDVAWGPLVRKVAPRPAFDRFIVFSMYKTSFPTQRRDARARRPLHVALFTGRRVRRVYSTINRPRRKWFKCNSGIRPRTISIPR